MRLFFAAPVPASDAFVHATAELGPCRPVPAGSWHITLRFLGTADPGEAMAALGSLQHAVLDLDVRGVGAFPRPQAARVAWAAVHAPGIEAVVEEVVAATAHLGRPPERRTFVPHVTLARFAHPQNVSAWHERHAHTRFAYGRIDHVRLMASRSGPDGTRHEELARFPLAEP